MKRAVIICGSSQYLVSVGDEIVVNQMDENAKLEFTPLMIVDGKESIIDPVALSKLKVTATLLNQERGDKVVALRYKAKKRVMTKRGHRQHLSKIKISTIK